MTQPRTARILAAALLAVWLAWAGTATAATPSVPRLDVHMDTGEADAVLAILRKRATGAAVTDADWRRLFATEGYVRLQRRERSLERPFEDDAFKTFVLSDDLAARAPALEATLARYAGADVVAAARRAVAYLPKRAFIHA